MSTWRFPVRLLNSFLMLGLCAGVGPGLAGCSATSGARTGSSASKAKTFLSVGDKPLPVVSGAPGSTVAADDGPGAGGVAPASRRRGRSDARISGRVFDPDGRPVADARVRLAVGGAPGGKVVSARTDRSGAFTLHGLRPGTGYTVIAEWDGDDGPMAGRADDARSSDTDVRISLAPVSDQPPPRASAPTRVHRVSDHAPAQEPETAADARPGSVVPSEEARSENSDRSAPRVNEEDLPPATEAEAMPPAVSSTQNGRASTSTTRSRSVGAGASSASWRPGGQVRSERESRNARPADDASPAGIEALPRTGSEPEMAPVDPETRGAGTESVRPSDPFDDGPNPLPPALEPIPDKSASLGPETPSTPPRPPAVADEPPRLASGGTEPYLSSNSSSGTRRSAASTSFESPSRPSAPASRPRTADVMPGALVMVPETFAPVVVHDGDPFAASRSAAPESSSAESIPPEPVRARPRPRQSPSRSEPARPRLDPQPLSATLTTAKVAPPPDRTAPDNARRRPKWGEVVASARTIPPVESDGMAAADADDRETIARADDRVTRRSYTVASNDGPGADRAARPVKAAALKPECDYDDRHRRVNDFLLPGLDGKPVRFQELDADLVLIDFWGTWCPPCLRSIPHLVELQERMGKRLAVVGVACETDAPETAATRVAQTVRKLKVNYPVLLSRNDGSCPLQAALHIQAFPTMILLDREGRVLWRDQGATPATLARLDRMLAISPGDETRKY